MIAQTDRRNLYRHGRYWRYERSEDGNRVRFSTGARDLREARKIRDRFELTGEKPQLPILSGAELHAKRFAERVAALPQLPTLSSDELHAIINDAVRAGLVDDAFRHNFYDWIGFNLSDEVPANLASALAAVAVHLISRKAQKKPAMTRRDKQIVSAIAKFERNSPLFWKQNGEPRVHVIKNYAPNADARAADVSRLRPYWQHMAPASSVRASA